MKRYVRCLAAALMLLTLVGCGSLGFSKIISRPSGQCVDEEVLRKEVEADSFPTAIQAGV